ncbi:GGDEF domain-containing protein [Psychromonas sp. MME2]|uniref:GGDEF domain-containing protein n=1 Tax=unclassified Psychromonas TaxID=2614957 RepID=UPI00339C98CA
MKDDLKRITDMTVSDLLQNEIILPSTYFKAFDQNAKNLSVNINSIQFESEVSTVITNEWESINNYMKKTIDNIDTLSEVTEHAQKAIDEKDTESLKSIGSSLLAMKKEINSLRELIYIDPLTQVFNRKWIYNHAITKEGKFFQDGVLVLIDVNDCNYLAKKYGQLIADNVIIYITKFLTKKLKHEQIEFDLVRYSNDQFIILIKNENVNNIFSFITNAKLELANATLKSKTGLIFKTSFNFGSQQYASNDLFQNTLENVAFLSLKDKA